jgi:ArsR family transcriptional regulator
MHAIKVYQCLCDPTRLRILNLLLGGPLCVCHLAAILKVAQPKISRHLKALREGGAVEVKRFQNWTICRLPKQPSPLLEANLKCLQDLRTEEKVFTRDLLRRAQTIEKIVATDLDDLPAQIRALTASCGGIAVQLNSPDN